MPKAMNMRRKVRALQVKLYHAEKQSLDRRFGALYDKIYRGDVLWTAWRLVRAIDGAPGIDEQDFTYIEREIGMMKFLADIGEELRRQRYRPRAVRRCNPSIGIRLEPDGKPEIVVYIQVDNVKETVEKAKALGAEVRIPPMDGGDVYFALTNDPEGNPIGLTQRKA